MLSSARGVVHRIMHSGPALSLGVATSLGALCFACRTHDDPRSAPAGSATAREVASAGSADRKHATTPAPTAPNFYVVARFDHTPELHKLEGALFISENNWLARISDARLVVDGSLSPWVSRRDDAWFGFQLSGTWPTEMVGAFTLPRGTRSWSRVLRYTPKGWKRIVDVSDASVLAASLWTGHRVLALKYPPAAANGPLFATQFVSWPAAPRLPKLAPAPRTRGPDQSGADVCAVSKTALVPAAMLGLPAGHVFVGGATCQKRYLAVEWFTPGRIGSQMQILKEQEDRGPSGSFATRAPGDVYLGLGSSSGSTLAHYDGDEWTVLDTPFSGFISSLDVTADGVLFVVARTEPYRLKGPKGDKLAVRTEDEGGLWRRSPQGVWTRIPVPDDVPMLHERFHAGVHGVAAVTAEDVWLTAGTALLHTRPPAGAIRDFTQQ